jgi:aminotransferase
MAYSISNRVRSIAPSATKEMALLAEEVGGCVSLGQGVPSFATPQHILEAVIKVLRDQPAGGKYTLQPGLPALRQALAEDMGRNRNLTVHWPTEILITVGAMEGLLATILTILDPGDEILVPSPGYASYTEQILLAEGMPVFVPLRSSDWGLDTDRLRGSLTPRTKAILLCNPSNPTGAVYSREDILAVGELALQNDLVIISDETYDFLFYEGPPPFSPTVVPELKDRVIAVSSFSKKFAFTGWRVGWVYSDARWMEQIMKVHDAAVIAAPTVSQYAALAAINGPQDVITAMRDRLGDRRKLCLERLDRLSRYFDYVTPRGAFYVLPRYLFTGEPSAALAVRLIREAQVITIPGASYGLEGEGRLRMSYGGEEADIDEAFDRLEGWLNGRLG